MSVVRSTTEAWRVPVRPIHGACLSAAALLCGLAWAGHRLVFAQFQPYDDEGYLLVTVRHFLQGVPLYDGVYTQYGPAYYLWQQLLHDLIRIPLTHDATRMVTVVLWIACSAIVGAMVWLLTRRPLLTTIGIAAAFFHLTQLTFEPGHPQELSLLGVVSAIAIVMWQLVMRERLGVPATIGIGVLVAFTALTKMNVGALLAGALTLGLVTSIRRSSWQAVLAGALVAAALAAVPTLMHDGLHRRDILACVVVVWSALLGTFVASRDDDAGTETIGVKESISGAAAFALACAAVVVVIVGKGTSLRALFEGLFVWPQLLPSVFWQPLPVPLPAALAAPVWIVGALCWRRNVAIIRRWMPLIALASGALMFLLSISKAYGPLLAWGPPLAWLVLADGSGEPGDRAARRCLAFAAILMTLQAYPMPDGTQIGLGTVLFVPVALATMGSAERSLRAPERPRARRSYGKRLLFAALVLALATNVGVTVQRLYASGIPLAMRGAEAVRASERQAATYWWLAANMREHCDAFLTAPGLNSLHFWTDLAPVSTLNTTLWPILLSDRQQQRIIDEARQVERLCVAWAPERMAALAHAPEIASRPLIAWLEREFEPRASFGGWEFRVRRGTRATLVYQGIWLADDGIAIALPPIADERATRLEVVDLDTSRTLADSRDANGIIVVDETGAPANTDSPAELACVGRSGQDDHSESPSFTAKRSAQTQLTQASCGARIDISRPRRLTLRGPVAPPSSPHATVVVRLFAGNDRTVAIVPIVAAARVAHDR